MTNRWLLRAYMLAKLPLALVAGLRIVEMDNARCVVRVPYGWRTTNPFRSTYFAAQSMAAEMSTGALVMAALKEFPQSSSMLIVGLEAHFGKKATATTLFTCTDGEIALTAMEEAVRTGEPVSVRMASIGQLPDGTEVSRFVFTWSVMMRRK